MNYNFNWTVIEKNIVPMLEGLGFGLLMAIIAITVGTIIGLLLAFAAVSKSKIARKLVQIFVTILAKDNRPQRSRKTSCLSPI